MATTLGNNAESIENNPPPVAASTFISGPGNKLTPFATAGKQDNPEGLRRLFHMAYMVFGLPETFFSDVSVGTLATATSLDRPTELKFKRDQQSWEQTFKTMGMQVLKNSIQTPNGKLREALKKRGMDPNDIVIEMAPARVAGGLSFSIREAVKKPNADNKITIDVKFPAILEGDMPATVGAIVEAMTLNGFEATGIDERTGMFLLMIALGVDDPKDVLEAMYPETQYKSVVDRIAAMKVQREQALNPPDPTQMGGEGPTGAAPHAPQPRKPHPRKIDAGTNPKEAMRLLREALKSLKN
jgi:hypothetical protein